MKLTLVPIFGGCTRSEYQSVTKVVEEIHEAFAPLTSFGVTVIVDTSTYILKDHPYDDNRGYQDSTFWQALNGRRPQADSARDHFIIGVCNETLQVASFNRQSAAEGCGVITIRDHAQYLPRGMQRGSYAVYLAACVYLMLRYGPDSGSPSPIEEHSAREDCLFDLCSNPDDLRSCLAEASMDHCKDDVLAAGADDAELSAIREILQTVRRRDLIKITTDTLGKDGTIFIAGIGTSFVTSVTATEWPRAAVALAASFLVLGAGLIFWRWAFDGARPIWAIRTSAFLAVALAIILWIAIVYFHIPGLPTDHPTAGPTGITSSSGDGQLYEPQATRGDPDTTSAQAPVP